MSSVLPLVTILFVAFALSQGLGWIFLRLRQPQLIGQILAGVVLANLAFFGSSAIGFLQLDAGTAIGHEHLQALSALADLGVIFLIFSVGLEVRSTELRAVGGLATYVAGLGVVVPFALGFAFMLFVGAPGALAVAVFVGAALVSTSVGIVARALQERGELTTPTGLVILGADVIDDILGILVLAFALAIAVGGHTSTTNLLLTAALDVLLAVVLVIFFLYIAPQLVRRATSRRDPSAFMASVNGREGPIIVAFVILFAASALASLFQLAAIIGAFLAGSALADVADRFGITRAVRPLNLVFVPFFFFYIGLNLDLGDLAGVVGIAVALTALAIVGKFAACALAARRLGRRSAATVGAAMIPRGEVGILIALAGLGVGVLSPGLYGALVLMAIVTSLVGPALYGWLSDRPIVGVAPPAETGRRDPFGGGLSSARGPVEPWNPALPSRSSYPVASAIPHVGMMAESASPSTSFPGVALTADPSTLPAPLDAPEPAVTLAVGPSSEPETP